MPTVLYTQQGCPDSDRVRACFRRSGVAFVERNVTADAKAVAALLATGVFVTPLVHTGDRLIIGARLDVLANRLGFRCACADAQGQTR